MRKMITCSQKEKEEIDKKIILVTKELLREGYNPGSIAYMLTDLAIDMSYAHCDNPHVIISNILSAVVRQAEKRIPKADSVWDEELEIIGDDETIH
jgi:hypothetical protein